MLVNMELSSCLAKSRLTLDLRWRPREENQEADELTNEIFTSFSMDDRVPLSLTDLDLGLVNSLWQTKLQFDLMRGEAKQHAAEGPQGKKRKHDKTPLVTSFATCLCRMGDFRRLLHLSPFFVATTS